MGQLVTAGISQTTVKMKALTNFERPVGGYSRWRRKLQHAAWISTKITVYDAACKIRRSL